MFRNFGVPESPSSHHQKIWAPGVALGWPEIALEALRALLENVENTNVFECFEAWGRPMAPNGSEKKEKWGVLNLFTSRH